MSRVVVGMSGGVDSAVAAHLLKKQGFEVIGLFMHNWHETEGDACTSEEDYSDVKRVCMTLDIPYYSVDFADEYMDRVFMQFVEEYKKGRTPNPDVLCNREIKFGPFLQHAEKMNADFVATGHYAGVLRERGRTFLTLAKDQNKDQTYFLNQLSEKQLEKVLFPLKDLSKPEVREIARSIGISNADKKDSTGICFVGERKFREFLSHYIPMKEGKIMCDGRVVGEHKGVYYYTLGQRKGLGIGGEGDNGRWFVIGKDVVNNILYVSHGDESELFSDVVECDEFNFINGKPDEDEFCCLARFRHRQPLQKVRVRLSGNGVVILCEEKQRAIAAGQYAVLYRDGICLGGGVMERSYRENG